MEKRFCKCDECGALGLWDGIFMKEAGEIVYFCRDCGHIFKVHPEFSSFLMHKNKNLGENAIELVESE